MARVKALEEIQPWKGCSVVAYASWAALGRGSAGSSYSRRNSATTNSIALQPHAAG